MISSGPSAMAAARWSSSSPSSSVPVVAGAGTRGRASAWSGKVGGRARGDGGREPPVHGRGGWGEVGREARARRGAGGGGRGGGRPRGREGVGGGRWGGRP